MSIAYEGNNSFCFDTDVFDSAKKVYAEKAKDLSDMKTKLVSAIDALKNSTWKSDAGKKFFDSIDANWATDIQRYSDLLDTLSLIIDEAATSFDNVVETAKLAKVDL